MRSLVTSHSSIDPSEGSEAYALESNPLSCGLDILLFIWGHLHGAIGEQYKCNQTR